MKSDMKLCFLLFALSCASFTAFAETCPSSDSLIFVPQADGTFVITPPQGWDIPVEETYRVAQKKEQISFGGMNVFGRSELPDKRSRERFRMDTDIGCSYYIWGIMGYIVIIKPNTAGHVYNLSGSFRYRGNLMKCKVYDVAGCIFDEVTENEHDKMP